MILFLKKTSAVILFAFLTFSCSKKEDSISTSSSSTTTTQIETWVKLTALTASSVVKPNYIIMMFDQPVTSNNALPPILKQVTTDASGLAYFDLNTLVTSTVPTTYYFEAFTPNGANYIWESISHPSYDLNKGKTVTSSIVVN